MCMGCLRVMHGALWLRQCGAVQVLKHFIIPILGADEPSSTAQLDNASIPAQLPQGPGDKPMTAEPEAAAPTEPAANAPVTAEVEHAAHAEPAADAPATADAAAAHAAVEAPAAPAVADVPAATAPVQASAPLAAVVAAADAAMPDAKVSLQALQPLSAEAHSVIIRTAPLSVLVRMRHVASTT